MIIIRQSNSIMSKLSLSNSESDEDSIDFTRCNRLESKPLSFSSESDEDSIDYASCNRLESHGILCASQVKKNGVKRKFTKYDLERADEPDSKKGYVVAGAETSMSLYKKPVVLQSDSSSENSRLSVGIKRKSHSKEINYEQKVKKPKLIKQAEVQQEVQLNPQIVQKKIWDGDIIVVKPEKNSKNYALYKVCRKLKSKSGQVFRNFFLCTSCGTILNIKLTTHHNQLKRHFFKCYGASPNILQESVVKVKRDEFFPLISKIIKMAAKYGQIDLQGIRVPGLLEQRSSFAFIQQLKEKFRHSSKKNFNLKRAYDYQ